MSVDISKLKSRVATFSNSLDDLESALESLMSQTLPETAINLEPLQQAKLQTDVPYVLYDLVFMYLKLKGVDPKTHPVVPELDRIRQYFDKISHAENPPSRKNEIDKAAAGRFIKHAISSVQWKKTAAEEEEPDASTSRLPIKITSKMAERAEYEDQLKERAAAGEEESEEEDLEIFDSEQMQVECERAPEEVLRTEGQRKRQRPTVDHFAGYGENGTEPPSIPQPKSKKFKADGLKKKKKGKIKADS